MILVFRPLADEKMAPARVRPLSSTPRTSACSYARFLGRLFDRKLPEDDADDVRKHIVGCDSCLNEAAMIAYERDSRNEALEQSIVDPGIPGLNRIDDD